MMNDIAKYSSASLLSASIMLSGATLAGGALDDIDTNRDSAENELIKDMESDIRKDDLKLLGATCLMHLKWWNGVENESRKKQKKEDAEQGPSGWTSKANEEWITPVPGSKIPASALIGIPEDGKYRIWMRRMGITGKPEPVTLTLAGANQVQHVFGSRALTSAPAKEQEKNGAILFEDEAVRMTFPSSPTPVWEYWDAELKKGSTDFALTVQNGKPQLSTLLITKSKSFEPKSGKDSYNNLNRVYYRIRVKGDPKKKAATYSIPSISMTYHWRFVPEGSPTEIWYSILNKTSFKANPQKITCGGKADIPQGQWTDWIDASWSATGNGPWATGVINFQKIASGEAEIELSWNQNPAAAVKKISAKIEDGKAVFMIPLCRDVVSPVKPDPAGKTPAWGIFDAKYLSLLESAEDVHRRELGWGKEAAKEMNLQEKQSPVKSFNFISGCNVAPSAMDAAAEMLTGLGMNALEGLKPAVYRQLNIEPRTALAYSDWGYLSDTHDPADPAAAGTIRKNLEKRAAAGEKENPGFRKTVKTIKLGDEIGAIASAEKINASADCRKRFHDYLRTILSERKTDSKNFFGTGNVEELECMSALPQNPGLFERRLYYHSHLFLYRLTADYYRQVTEAAKDIFPEAKTYANFSPHPITLGDQTMNHSEWFSLSRKGASSMAWGEDWASAGGTWGYHGVEVVSYYGAWVECAARKNNDPAGFYNVVTCGSPDHKAVSLASRNIRNIRFYEFGPMYAVAEGSNSWSETKEVYPAIVKATHVFGLVDDILNGTKPESRKVALLYNRPDEIMNGGTNYIQLDRALTFAALGNAHRNADIILTDDLLPDMLKNYQVLYINGFNLPAASVPAIKEWVEKGGTLVVSGGSGRFDEYGNPLTEFSAVCGAEASFADRSIGSPHPVALNKHKPIDKVKVDKTGFSPALEADVVGLKFILKPSSGKTIAKYADGSCAGVLNQLGKGNVICWGFQPGLLYKGDVPGTSAYRSDRLDLVAAPAAGTLGPASVDCDAPQMEMTRFENEKGIAVLLNNFNFRNWKKELPPAKMTVRTDRKISKVESAMSGTLKWNRRGDVVEIELPLPQSVDTIALKE